MNTVDIAVIVFVALLSLNGGKNGFIKTALGMVSVIVCGVLTAILYRYISDAGIISIAEDKIFSLTESETVLKLKKMGIVGYVVSSIVAAAVFAVVRICYNFLAGIFGIAVPRLLNSLLGLILGALQGVAVVFCVLAVVRLVNGSVPEVTEWIEKTKIVAWCYENNPVLDLL